MNTRQRTAFESDPTYIALKKIYDQLSESFDETTEICKAKDWKDEYFIGQRHGIEGARFLITDALTELSKKYEGA